MRTADAPRQPRGQLGRRVTLRRQPACAWRRPPATTATTWRRWSCCFRRTSARRGVGELQRLAALAHASGGGGARCGTSPPVPRQLRDDQLLHKHHGRSGLRKVPGTGVSEGFAHTDSLPGHALAPRLSLLLCKTFAFWHERLRQIFPGVCGKRRPRGQLPVRCAPRQPVPVVHLRGSRLCGGASGG